MSILEDLPRRLQMQTDQQWLDAVTGAGIDDFETAARVADEGVTRVRELLLKLDSARAAAAPAKHVAIVTNNNQPGWTNIVETAPNVTLHVGSKLYDESALIGVGVALVEQRAAEIIDLEYRLDAATTELANVMKALADPAAVWANMLRGTIARPKALEHYEECTAKLEAAESRLDQSEAQCASWKARHDMMELGRDALQSRLDAALKERNEDRVLLALGGDQTEIYSRAYEEERTKRIEAERKCVELLDDMEHYREQAYYFDARIKDSKAAGFDSITDAIEQAVSRGSRLDAVRTKCASVPPPISAADDFAGGRHDLSDEILALLDEPAPSAPSESSVLAAVRAACEAEISFAEGGALTPFGEGSLKAHREILALLSAPSDDDLHPNVRGLYTFTPILTATIDADGRVTMTDHTSAPSEGEKP